MQSSDRYYLLDAMRGIGAIAVLQYHAKFITNISQSGYLAVDFFFALSGFIIALEYESKLRSGFSLRKFIESRIKRLYPLYLVGFMLGVSVFVAKNVHGLTLSFPVDFVTNALLLPSPTAPVNFFPFNEPSWSLCMEVAVNLLFALVLFRLRTPVLVLISMIAGVA